MAIRTAPQGLGLIEVMVALALMATLVSLAVPALNAWLQRHRLAGVSAELVTDLQYARSEAVRRQISMRVEFNATTDGSCYFIHTGTGNACQCDPAGTTTCSAPAEVLKTVFRPAAEGVSVTVNHDLPLIFGVRHGTVTPGATISVASSAGTVVQHKINMMGRVRLCTVGEAALGHEACSP